MIEKIVVAAVIVVGAFAMNASAKAVDASGPGVTAVQNKRASLPSATHAALFANPAPGTLVPQWTPGGGVYQFFTGSAGTGAIYWEPGKAQAFILYGAILSQFAATGYEVTNGYPRSDERNPQASWPCDQAGLGSPWREQEFGVIRLGCWNPSSGAWFVDMGI